jgi:acyl transferase domain-containing protein
MEINQRLKAWDVPLRAVLVNSCGAAGSNCALLCCEFPAGQKGASETRRKKEHKIHYPVILSASSRNALVSTAKAVAKHLSESSATIDVADVAFTLGERRKRQKFCFDALATNTGVFDGIQAPSVEYPKQAKPVVLVFSDQFDSKVGLSRGIYDTYPTFRSYVDACGEEVVRLGYQSIRTAFFQTTPISSAALLQCSFFAVQYACANFWIDAGLQSQAIIGHSLGELAALAVSGVLSLADALKLVAFRANLIDTKWGSEKGAMLATQASPFEVRNLFFVENLWR